MSELPLYHVVGSARRLIDSCRLKDLLGPVTRVKKKGTESVCSSPTLEM